MTIGVRLKDFPKAFEELKSYSNFNLIECPAVSESLVLKVHSLGLLRSVIREPLCSTAWHSAGGVVLAGEMVYLKKLRNAFCYIGAGGHHASKEDFWGFCCFNDVVLSITNLREKYDNIKFAILDTDVHHGDGTRKLLAKDVNTLHFCICDHNYTSPDGTKIDVDHWELSSEEYVRIVKETFGQKAKEFGPDLMFWYFGHDGHIGEYGDIGLTVKDYVAIAGVLKTLAKDVCDERLIVVLAGGSLPSVAKESTLAIIKELLKP